MRRIHGPQLPWIPEGAPPECFPPAECALDRPEGLLALGGDLRPERLLCAYRLGIFPWYSQGQPILWWCPNPRAALFPDEVHVSRSLAKRLRRGDYRMTENTVFAEVVRQCAGPRKGADGTWITDEMQAAYAELHHRGHARSVECWQEDRLVGGLYGVAIGRVFFGESMFSRASDASKVALVHLCRAGYELIDCQLPNPHLTAMGARLVERHRFLELLERWCTVPGP